MNKTPLTTTKISDIENNFPKLIEFWEKNDVSVKTATEMQEVLEYSSSRDGTNPYLQSLCRPTYTRRWDMIQHKEELKKYIELAKMNTSMKDALIWTLSRNWGYNCEQFIHKACSSDEIYSLIMDVFRAHNLNKEKVWKVMETKHTRDYGSSYFPFTGYHALQQYNTLFDSTNAIEKDIDLIPENHVRRLASRVRFWRQSHWRNASYWDWAYDSINEEVNKLYWENVTPKEAINKWHHAKLLRVCTESLQPFYGNLWELSPRKDPSKIKALISHHTNILNTSLLKYWEKWIGENNRQKISTHVFSKITFTSATYLNDTIRDLIVRPLLLPILLNQLDMEEQIKLKELNDEKLANKIEKKLSESFLSYLTKSTDLTLLAQLTQKAHKRLGVLEKARDFSWQGDRHSILEDKEVNLWEYKAIIVDNADQLWEEWKRNKTCLGWFWWSCLAGSQHVVVFRNKNNESIWYVRLWLKKFDKDKEIGNNSFLIWSHNWYSGKYILNRMYLTSPNNISPKEDVSEAFKLFKNKISNWDIHLNVENIGKIESANKVDAFTNRVWFDFTNRDRIQKNFEMITARNWNPAWDSFSIRLAWWMKKTLINKKDRNLAVENFWSKGKLFASALKKLKKELN